MKKTLALLTLGSLFGWFLPASAQDSNPFYLVQNGESQGAIVLPENSSEAVTLAAHELQTYLEKISGAKLAIVSQPPASGASIAFQLLPDNTMDHFVHDTFTLDAGKNRLLISGHSDVAVLYGAYQFLNNLGVQWLSPGEIGEVVPKMADIKVKDGTKTYRPSFRTRGIDYSGANDWHFNKENQEQQHQDYDLWLLRNKLQFVTSLHNNLKLHHYNFGYTKEYFGHHIRPAAFGPKWRNIRPTAEDPHPNPADLAPERMALVTRDGVTERTTYAAQICFTNEENIETAIQSAVDYFGKYPERYTYPISLADTSGICECAKCIAANGGVFPPKAPNRVVWKFMNAVAKGLAEKMPGKNIGFYATYGKMTHPPEDIKAESNIVAAVAHVGSQARPIDDPEDPYNANFMDNVRLVNASGAKLRARDYLMYAGNPQPLTILEDIKTYHQQGVVSYYAEWMGRDQQRYLVAWAMAQLLWNADQNPQALLEKYAQEYYGAAGPKVLAWLNLMESRVRAMKRITLGNFGSTAMMLTPEVVAEGNALLVAAEKAVSGPERERVRALKNTFEVLYRAGQLDRLYQEALDQRTEASKEKVLDAVASYTDFWEKNHLSQTCSPLILDVDITGYIAKVKEINSTVAPLAAKDLVDASRPELIKALFTNAEADAPAELSKAWETGSAGTEDGIFLLPELWKFKVDPTDMGNSLRDQSGQGAPPFGRSDFDDSQWVQLSTYNTFDAQGFSGYTGVFWYRVKFQAPAFAPGEKVWLRIGSLDDDGAIYVNGQYVGERVHVQPDDWTTSFAFDVTKQIKPGQENVIAIRGLNLYGAGGLWKPVGLYTDSEK